MSYPPLVYYQSTEEYLAHYERVYCRAPVISFDGIEVRFRKSRFRHIFFESSRRDEKKDIFSIQRSERIDWIKAALRDSAAELYVGWDKKGRRYDPSHRVAVAVGNYVVIIRLSSPRAAEFVTAFVADSASTIAKIRSGPIWPKQ